MQTEPGVCIVGIAHLDVAFDGYNGGLVSCQFSFLILSGLVFQFSFLRPSPRGRTESSSSFKKTRTSSLLCASAAATAAKAAKCSANITALVCAFHVCAIGMLKKQLAAKTIRKQLV